MTGEITTGERPATKAREEIIQEAKRLEETTLYSMKGHQYAAGLSGTWGWAFRLS
jgi:hypothetical protein